MSQYCSFLVRTACDDSIAKDSGTGIPDCAYRTGYNGLCVDPRARRSPAPKYRRTLLTHHGTCSNTDVDCATREALSTIP